MILKLYLKRLFRWEKLNKITLGKREDVSELIELKSLLVSIRTVKSRILCQELVLDAPHNKLYDFLQKIWLTQN